MESRKICPISVRLSSYQINRLEEQRELNIILRYHRALESAETQIEKLELEKKELFEKLEQLNSGQLFEKLDKLEKEKRELEEAIESWKKEEEIWREENTRLKELIKESWFESAKKSMDVPIAENLEEELFQEWLKSHNIEYTEQ